MNYDAVARDILTLAGGPGNVENLTHCFTRLRFELSDRTKADKEKLAQVEAWFPWWNGVDSCRW